MVVDHWTLEVDPWTLELDPWTLEKDTWTLQGHVDIRHGRWGRGHGLLNP